MSFTRVWKGGDSGATTDVADDKNWEPVNIRNGSFQWTASGSGTNEFYLEASGGGDPSIVVEPDVVQEDGSDMTNGTMGSLAAGEYDYGDNDTLGFSTIYVRLADDADPDSKVLGFVTFTDTPQAGDSVIVPANSDYALTTNVTALAAVSLVDWTVEKGFSKALGTDTADLLLTLTGTFAFAGSAQSYINLQASNVPVEVTLTNSPPDGEVGLYLTGSNLTVVNLHGGTTGIAWRGGETSTVDKIRVTSSQASVCVGSGTTISTSYYQSAGRDCRLHADCTNIDVHAGKLTTDEAAAVTGDIHGGEVVSNATGASTWTLRGGTLDFLTSGLSRTVTALTVTAEDDCTLRLDEVVVTVSSFTRPSDRAVEMDYSAA